MQQKARAITVPLVFVHVSCMDIMYLHNLVHILANGASYQLGTFKDQCNVML